MFRTHHIIQCLSSSSASLSSYNVHLNYNNSTNSHHVHSFSFNSRSYFHSAPQRLNHFTPFENNIHLYKQKKTNINHIHSKISLLHKNNIYSFSSYSRLFSKSLIQRKNNNEENTTHNSQEYSYKKQNQENNEDTDENERQQETPSKQKKSLRSGIILNVGIALIFILVALYGIWRQKKGEEEENPAAKVSQTAYGDTKLGGSFELIDDQGEKRTEQDLLGHWSLLYFGFSHCPEICPSELSKLTRALDIIDQRDEFRDLVDPVFISVDPIRDSPSVLHRYLSKYHPRFMGLTGPPEDVQEMCQKYRVYVSVPDEAAPDNKEYQVDHSIVSYLMDPEGRFVEFFGRAFTEQEVADKICEIIEDRENKNK